MSPLVSIITPTYNHEKYISECLQTIIDQTFKDWELIIVNDGSTDGTVKAIEPFLSDKRIKLFSRKNVGIFRLKETYNYALSHAKGKYIAVIEGDDLWEQDKLRLQVDTMERNPEAVLCWGRSRNVSADKKKIYGIYPDLETDERFYYNNDPIGCILNILFFHNCVPAQTTFFRKDVLLKIGGFQQAYGLPLVDLVTIQEFATLGKFCFLEEPLSKWRMYAKQTTKTYPAEMMNGFYQLAKNNISRFKEKNDLAFSIDENKIDSYYKKQLVIAYSRSGRYKLIRKDFNDARKDFKTSIIINGFINPTWKLRSIVGYIFSLFHLNLEKLSKIMGRDNYLEE